MSYFCCGEVSTCGSADIFKNGVIGAIKRSQVGTHKGTQ